MIEGNKKDSGKPEREGRPGIQPAREREREIKRERDRERERE